MDVERAKAISDVAQTLINSAKAEIDLVRAVGGARPGSTKFFSLPEESRDLRSLSGRREGAI